MSENYLSHNGSRRVLALLLTLALLISIVPMTVWAGDQSATTSDAGPVLEDVIQHYYKNDNAGVLKDWEELLAIYAAEEALTDYVMPTKPSSVAGAVITSLILGDLSSAGEAASGFVLEGQFQSTGLAFIDAPNMIAIEAYNRAASISDGYSIISYDKNDAISSLLELEEDGGGFGFDIGEPDTTGMVLIALSLYTEDKEIDSTVITGIGGVIENCKKYLKSIQEHNGGFANWGKNNANSVAYVILGLIAVGEDPMDWVKDGKSPLDALLSFHVENGGFGYTSNIESNAFATKQATLALAEALRVSMLAHKTPEKIRECSTLRNLSINSKQYLSVVMQVVDSENDFTEKEITAVSDENLKDVLARALSKEKSDEELVNYNYYIDKILLDEEEEDSYLLQANDIILALHDTFEKIVYFKADDEDPIGVTETTIGFADFQELTLVEIDLSDNIENPLPQIPIDTNSDIYRDMATDLNGMVTITPIESRTVARALKSESVYDYEEDIFSTITYFEGNVAVLPAIINMKSGGFQSYEISIRVEGKTENILYKPIFEVSNEGESRLTVFDAVKQALDEYEIPYTATSSYISSIGGEDSEGYSGWLWLYNGGSLDVGMSDITIKDDDEIIVFYGDYPPVLPDIGIQKDGENINLTFKNVINGNPIEGVSLYWNGIKLEGVTDNTGKITIENVASGFYTLQLEKVNDGIPQLVRLAPGYTITIDEEGAAGEVPGTPGDDGAKVYITVKGPNRETIYQETAFTYKRNMTALSLLRQTKLRIEYSDQNQIYVSSIEGFEEFDYGPTSGWLFMVNGDESILSSAASYKLEAGDDVVWFYTKDYTKESGSVKWSGEQVVEETGSISKEELNSILKDIEAGKEDSWTVSLAQGDIAFNKDALANLMDKMTGDSVDITIEQASNKDLSAKQRQAAGDRPVYDIKITSGKKEISQFGGKLTISLPYTLKDGERPSGIVVYHLDAEGNLVPMEGAYDPVTGKVVFTVDHLSYFMIGYDETLAKWPFADVAENDNINWFYSPVKFVYERGIFSGTSATTFAPNRPLTRSMLASVLARMSGADLTAYKEVSFGDVDINSWYGPSVAWAKEMGIVSGYANKDGSFDFRPDAKISRQDIAVMINNYNEKIAKKVYDHKARELTFTDQQQISKYAKEAVKSMQRAGIINGIKNADGSFRLQPINNATRAEAATMIYNMLSKE